MKVLLVNHPGTLKFRGGDLTQMRKTAEAPGFVAHAILGFEKDENLFVENDRWTATHVPATLARGPFL